MNTGPRRGGGGREAGHPRLRPARPDVSDDRHIAGDSPIRTG